MISHAWHLLEANARALSISAYKRLPLRHLRTLKSSTRILHQARSSTLRRNANSFPYQIRHQSLSSKPWVASQDEARPKKESDEVLDSLAKKLGWILTGSAICAMSYIYGQIYLISAVVPLVLFNAKDVFTISKTFKRDATFLRRYAQYWTMGKRIQNHNLTLPKVFYDHAEKYPNKTMLQISDQPWKYKDVRSYANRVSRMMQRYGFQKGDVVAVFCNSSPEMVALILGMANLGITTALINTELRNEGLITAIKNSKCRAIIFDDDKALGDYAPYANNVLLFQMRHKVQQADFIALEDELLKESTDNPEIFSKLSHTDPLLHLQSGDPNCKKPQSVTHEQFLRDAWATVLMLGLKSTDKIYNPTPLHDFNGLILGVGPSIMHPVTVVLRSKFSAKDYFRECYVQNCTVAQYAGSMCKQLLLSPVTPIETFHPVKIMYGCGMENDYWQEFVNRFHTRTFELLDCFTRDINLMNTEGAPGVVGFRPKIVPSALFPHYVIRVFGKEGIPVRNDDGSCQLCRYDEPGLLVRMWDQQRPPPRETYLLENIFKKGDVAITQGEILTMDRELYLHTLNKYEGRTWMAKLVTMNEVERLVSVLTNQKCVSYSSADIHVLTVEDPKASLKIDKIADSLMDHLPTQRLPQYIRFVNKLETLANGEINIEAVMKEELKSENNIVYRFDSLTSKYRQFIWPSNEVPQSSISFDDKKMNVKDIGVETKTFVKSPIELTGTEKVAPGKLAVIEKLQKLADSVNPALKDLNGINQMAKKSWFTTIEEAKEKNNVVIVPLSRFKTVPLEPCLADISKPSSPPSEPLRVDNNHNQNTTDKSKLIEKRALETLATFSLPQTATKNAIKEKELGLEKIGNEEESRDANAEMDTTKDARSTEASPNVIITFEPNEGKDSPMKEIQNKSDSVPQMTGNKTIRSDNVEKPTST